MGEVEVGATAELHTGPGATDPAVAGVGTACRWCGDPNVVFINRLGAHCADCHVDGRESQRLHEVGL